MGPAAERFASSDAPGVETNPLLRHQVALLAAAAALAVLIANVQGIAVGDDGVGYRAIADSLLAGDGYGYFLEDPVTVWPPVWPVLMAVVARLSPLDPLGAAIVLNALTAAAAVLVGNRLLRTVVSSSFLVSAGTVVLALGPATIGLGHVLMTDLAFAVVLMVWMLALIGFHRSASLTHLLGAAALAWLAFGVRYVGLVLIAFGGLWLLADARRPLLRRVRDGVLYGVAASVVPLAWMLRNRSIDGTFTGERNPSARGLVDNGFDVAATLGRFLVPGVGNGLTRLWAAVGLVVLAVAIWLTWKVLGSPATDGDAPLPAAARLRRAVHGLGAPIGLIAGFGVLYLAYMLYVRTTTALNQLDLRLLFPAYFPLLVTAMFLAGRVQVLEPTRRWSQSVRVTVTGWAAINVVVGLIGMVAFAAGHPYFEGNYESDVFEEVRASSALEQVPAGCVVYSNLPNALYPTLGARWSPQQRALESSREVPDLERVERTLDEQPSCLVWIDEPPWYGHLWTLDELSERLSLEQLATDGSVTVYVMERVG